MKWLSAMDVEDQAKLERMKELEAMVKKLTQENEKLLTQVKGEDKQDTFLTNGKSNETAIENGQEDLILLSDMEDPEEDEW